MRLGDGSGHNVAGAGPIFGLEGGAAGGGFRVATTGLAVSAASPLPVVAIGAGPAWRRSQTYRRRTSAFATITGIAPTTWFATAAALGLTTVPTKRNAGRRVTLAGAGDCSPAFATSAALALSGAARDSRGDRRWRVSSTGGGDCSSALATSTSLALSGAARDKQRRPPLARLLNRRWRLLTCVCDGFRACLVRCCRDVGWAGI